MDKLIYVDDSLPGITRKRSGRGWSYYDPQGDLVTDKAERERLNAIALPPAYRDAWYCPAPNGHILATGVDDRGRKQYRYHPSFREQREMEKFEGCIAFGHLLPLVRRRVEEDLEGTTLTRERALASVVRLLDLGVIRVGNEAYARSNNSYGATTLRNRHAKITGHTLRLRFRGKGGKLREAEVSDRSLVSVVKRLQDLPGQRLFRYVDDAQEYHPVTSDEVNEYLWDTMGEKFTAKNFRTWHASVLAFEIVVETQGDIGIGSLTERVAEALGNTPAVTRRSYIHPAMFDLLSKPDTIGDIALPRATKWLSREERGLLAYLEDAPPLDRLMAA
ncbi:MAG: DNA topoisomerase IB, partial [Erythrobacter sp.]|jgi:DNA topoisomerase-1|nr:DNA topoisomerase IB [Erythrobacter sp.]